MSRIGLFCLLIFFAVNYTVTGQTPSYVWVRDGVVSTGGNFAQGVKMVTDSAGNSYVAGSFSGSSLTLGSTVLSATNNGEPTLYVAKYDANGNLLWVKQTLNCYLSQPSSIALDKINGKVYVTGRYCTTSTLGAGTFGTYDFTTGFNSMYLAQLDASTGDVGWLVCSNVGSVQNVNTSSGNSVITYGNYIYLVGEFTNTVIFGADTITSVGDGDAYIAKYSNSGIFQWIKTAGYAGVQNYFSNVVTDADGNAYIAAGYTNEITIGAKTYSGGGILTAKYDSNGNIKWSNSSGGYPITSDITDLVSDGAGNLYLAGLYGNAHGTLTFGTSTFTGNAGEYEIFVTKFDTSGNNDWIKSPGNSANTFYGPGITLDQANNIYLTGAYNGTATFGSTSITAINNGNTTDIFVAKCDTGANALWAKTAGGLYTDAGKEVGVDDFGNVYVTGYIGADGSPTTVSFDNITDTVQPNETYSFTAKIGVPLSPPVAQFIINNTCITTGQPVTFTDQSTGFPASWQWTFAGGNPGSSNSQNPSVTYADTGTYNVRLVVANSGGSDTLTKMGYVIVYANAVAGTISGPSALCQGNSVQLSDTGNTSQIQWQSSPDGISFSNLGDTLATYTNTSLDQTTWYQLIASGVCNEDTSNLLKVVVNNLPLPLISTADSLICSNDSTQICPLQTFATYEWNTGDTSACTVVNQAGGYWVTVTDTNGCSAVSGHQDISVYPVPSVSIVEEGDTLSSFGAISYQWFYNGDSIPGATSFLYIAKNAGSYAVQITDSNGCRALSSSKFVAVTTVTEFAESNQVNICPNPFTDNLFIQLEDAGARIKSVAIFDEMGRISLSREFGDVPSNLLQLDVSALPPGVYYIKIITNESQFTRPVIRQ